MFQRHILAALSLFFCVSLASLAQDTSPSVSDKTHARRVEWLRENAIKINSRSIHKTKYKRDLIHLKEKIGDARIVMLGEADHGEGATFEMKGRLIRFLHEEMGFNVLAWESGLYDCKKVDDAFKTQDVPLQTAVERGIYGIFCKSEQIRPLLEYLWDIRNSDNPMIQVGFDCQFSSFTTYTDFPDWVEELFRESAGVEPDADIMADMRDKLGGVTRDTPWVNTIDFNQTLLDHADYFLDLFESNRAEIEKNYSRTEVLFAHRALINFQQFVNAKLQGIVMSYRDTTIYTKIRDKAMADTLIMLADEMYPDEKIVVWAHSFHISRNLIPALIEAGWEMPVPPYKVMGDWAHEHFGDDMYSVGVIAYEGHGKHATRDYSFDIPPAEKGTMAWYFHELGKKYYLLDVKALPERHWLRKKQKARVVHRDLTEFVIPDVFDALLYIERMTPSTLVPEYR